MRNILASVNRYHSGQLFCGAGINVLDPGVRVNGAQEHGMKRIRQLDVVNVMGESLNQPRIFGTL
jgi:hypothetical protein